jgi:hypothetical protein
MAMQTIRGFLTVAAAALAAALSLPAAAQDAGTVQFASGSVEVLRGAQRLPAQKGTVLLQGDSVVTAAASSAQLRMVDGALVSLRPSTQMAIERYEFDEAKAAPGEALLGLVRGTMRTFTGLIVARDRDKFRLRTTIANVGIRGSGNILAHSDAAGTINHTLTGAHGVTSKDAAGVERTLVSYPGQTIQVLPGLAPRFIPTPPSILAGASQGSKSASAEEKAAGDTKSTTGSSPEEGGAVAEAGVAPDPTIASSQATTSTVAAAIVAAQPAPNALFEALVRTANPYAGGGFEGVFGQTSYLGDGGAILDAEGRLVRIRNVRYDEFLAGGGALPPGYQQLTIEGADLSLVGGTHYDGFRTPDGAITIGRWQGGSIVVSGGTTPGGSYSIPVGPRSVAYEVNIPLHPGIFGTFTGSTTYTLVAATSPTDAFGNVGSVSSATVNADFGSQTVTGSVGLAVNGQSFSISGSDTLTRNPTRFAFATSLGNISIGCTGSNCASQGYQGTFNGGFAGVDGRWATLSYRVNPTRLPERAFDDWIAGSIVLGTLTPPTVGIQLPQTGTANLAFTGASFIAPGDFGPPINGTLFANEVSGTLQANFANRTVGFTATIGSLSPESPTYVASASGAPIIGAGFSASTSPGPGQAPLTVTCTGSPCGAAGTGIGRFDGLFTDSSGQRGQATFSVGDSLGIYNGGANFGPGTLAFTRALAADVQHGAAAIVASPASAAAAVTAAAAIRSPRIALRGPH